MGMKMQIIFYRTPSGQQPVREYLASLPLRDRAAAADVLDAIREDVLHAPGVRFKQIRESYGSFTLRPESPIAFSTLL